MSKLPNRGSAPKIEPNPNHSKPIDYDFSLNSVRFCLEFGNNQNWLYLKPGMEQTETERKKIGLKHGNGIFQTERLKNGKKIIYFIRNKIHCFFFIN